MIEGGQTMNPSTEEIVAAVDATPATEVIVLPNNSNVILSAEQAVGLVNKPMRVLPTRSVQAGLAAMIAYDPESPAAENESAMAQALEGLATGEITIASRDVTLDGIEVRKGAWLGLADGAAVASGQSFDAVAGAVAERLLDGGREILTLLTGADEPQLHDARRARSSARHPEVEIEIHAGRPAALPVAPLGGVTMAVRVLLVEDNEVYRSTLELLLDGRDGIEIVGLRRGRPRGGRGSGAPRPGRRPDGFPAARPRRRRGDRRRARRARPVRRSLCLTAEATAADRDAVLAAGAVGLIEKGRPIDDLVRAIRSATEPRGADSVNLTSENTAIVLDSTSDFPEAKARERFDEHPGRAAATSSSAPRASATTSDISLSRLLRAPEDRGDAADDVAADARRLPRRVRGSRGVRARSTRCICPRSSPARSSRRCTAAGIVGGDRIRLVDSETASLAVAMLALAIERRLARGTTDDELEALIDRFKRDNAVVFTVGTLEYLQKGGRIGKAQALAGALLNVKPILSVDDGVVVPGRQGARPPEGAGRVRAACSRRRPRIARASGSRSRTPTRRSGWRCSPTSPLEGAAAGGDRARREPRRRRRHARRPRRRRLLLVPGLAPRR